MHFKDSCSILNLLFPRSTDLPTAGGGRQLSKDEVHRLKIELEEAEDGLGRARVRSTP